MAGALAAGQRHCSTPAALPTPGAGGGRSGHTAAHGRRQRAHLSAGRRGGAVEGAGGAVLGHHQPPHRRLRHCIQVRGAVGWAPTRCCAGDACPPCARFPRLRLLSHACCARPSPFPVLLRPALCPTWAPSTRSSVSCCSPATSTPPACAWASPAPRTWRWALGVGGAPGMLSRSLPGVGGHPGRPGLRLAHTHCAAHPCVVVHQGPVH